MDWRRPFGRRREDALEVKDSRAGPLIALTSAGRHRWTPRDYAHLAEEGFAKNAVAYRCVRMIAEAAASTPLSASGREAALLTSMAMATLAAC